ncbi:zinc finger protein 79-like [Uloborus diversus]|uniref:zinc finger protein 79-like n=1 Tax=Uloborus diversus TaxID=327109 RepID=UPI00240A2307|nr:zinc finger protein 79-like [Uloborus diversus]
MGRIKELKLILQLKNPLILGRSCKVETLERDLFHCGSEISALKEHLYFVALHETSPFDENQIAMLKVLKSKHRKFQCIHCNYVAHTSSNLRNHIRVHTGERPFQCPVCNKDFTQKGNMLRHVTKHFIESVSELRNRTCDWDLLAIYSGIKQELIGDKDMNSTNHPFKCNLCPYTTFLPTVLRQHMLTHSIERPYKCPICAKGFTQKGSVQLHMLHHTGERPHKCPVCQRCYSQKGSMRRHILQHLSKNSNKCPLCPEIFELRSEVEVHLIQHTKKDSFFCSACQATFTSAINLDEHNKIHHSS